MVDAASKKRGNDPCGSDPARKITKIAREAEHLVLLALRGDGVGTAEIDCIHAVRHHPGVTQAELTETLNSDKAAIARRTASLESARDTCGANPTQRWAAGCSIRRRRRRDCAMQRPKRRALFTTT